jgi:adenylate cyclase
MSAQGVKRKLSAILSADVEGYSRLMAEDEVATVQTLTTYREVMTGLIQQHRGRVVDSPGDNLLAEFSSVVDAVQCAVAVQKEFQARNAELPEERRMEFRIGINLGDVIEEGDRIYGDGVNIAARLEALAEPGGICISKTAFDQIETKLPLGYEYLGNQTVKNIPKPVGAYRVTMEPRVSVVGKREKLKRWTAGWRGATFVGAIVAIIAIIGAVSWNFYFRPWFEPAPKTDIEAFWKTEWLPLPEKPSIAVLPFDNLGDDPKEDYFSDGLAEDIITDLAKISGMFVIARHSSFRYKGKTVDVQQVGRELGVRYLLEGSVRRAGNRVRINAQLVDAVNGNHLWSERYDREQKDLFKLQNEIVKNIVTALDVKLVEGEQAKLYRKATDHPEAYDAFAKGFNLFRQFRKDANSLAQQYLSKAIELDPKYAGAMGLLGTTHWADARFGWSTSRSQSIQKGKELALKALTIDDKTYLALSALSLIHLLEKDYDRCMEIREQAFSINPNSADSNALVALTLSLVGREEEALPYQKTAMRLSPFYPFWYLSTLCDIFRLTGRHDEAIATAKAIIELNLPLEIEVGRLYLAAIMIELGKDEEARGVAAEYLKLRPTFSLKRFKKTRIYKDPKVTEKLISQLRKAGFPD